MPSDDKLKLILAFLVVWLLTVAVPLMVALLWNPYTAPYYVCQSHPSGGIIVEASDPRNVGQRCDI